MDAPRLAIFFSLTIGYALAQLHCPVRDPSLTGCERSCSADLTCRKAGKICECDGNCGWSCVRLGCETIDDPANGNVAINPQNRSIGSVATFTCDFGYNLHGSENLECLGNKTWNSSTDTTCECSRNDNEVRSEGRRCLRSCSSDSECIRGRICVCDDICGLSCILTDLEDYCNTTHVRPDNVITTITPPTAVFGAIAQQTCQEGFVSNEGSIERRCQGGKEWSNRNLECIPEQHCSAPPPVVKNAQHDGDRSYYLPGDRIRYTCNPGYYHTGTIQISCLHTFIWETTNYECLPRNCGNPENIVNGRIRGTVYTFPSSVTYFCDEGYYLVGRDTRHCQTNQEWSGTAPSCVSLPCPDPGYPENGFATWDNRNVHFTCDDGYSLVGAETITCGGDSTWTPEQIPSCAPTFCMIEDLPTVPYRWSMPRREVEKGRLVPNDDKKMNTGRVTNNDSLQIKCEDGFRLRNGRIIWCRAAEWKPSTLFCEQSKN